MFPLRPRINGQIKSDRLKLVTEDGSELGTFSLHDALKLVASRREDLVEIQPQVVPPVCLVIDYGKYRFRAIQEEKKRRGF